MVSIKVKYTYSDGTNLIKYFKSEKEMQWSIHNEGDHLINYEII